jgi:phosphate starvation-inducible PhoH-like protein
MKSTIEVETALIPVILGQNDEYLKFIKKRLNINIIIRGKNITLDGQKEDIEFAEKLLRYLMDIGQKRPIYFSDVEDAFNMMTNDMNSEVSNILSGNIQVSGHIKHVYLKNERQFEYINAIKKFDLVFSIGPAGTGKTYLAMAMAINMFLNKDISRIILARPAVEAGESLGFLPGDIADKINPYLRPLYDALYNMMEIDKANRLIEKGVIELAPLAYMRGRTLNDSFIILDEAQNTTIEQMKMFLTRLGFNSKVVVTGDITQIDLPYHKKSGLVIVKDILEKTKGIKFIYFTEKDVVRHSLVQSIIKAFDKYEKNKSIENKNIIL